MHRYGNIALVIEFCPVDSNTFLMALIAENAHNNYNPEIAL